MRAAHRDAIIERGTTWRLAFQVWAPSTTTQAASTLVPGDHVVVKGAVQVVYSNTPINGTVELRFGQGLWSDAKLVVKATELFQMAAQVAPSAVRAGYEYDYDSGPYTVEIESAIAEDGTVVLTITDANTWLLPDGCGQWDLSVQQSSGDWLRALEGQFSAIPTVSGHEIPAPEGTGYGYGPYGGS